MTDMSAEELGLLVERVNRQNEQISQLAQELALCKAKAEEAEAKESVVHGREKAVLMAQISTLVSNKVPPSFWQGVKAWQRICMLLNVKTNIRNIFSNASVVPVFMLADAFGAAI